ncbi:MAG: alkaline phosphatase family protein [Thermoplasmata archaeon]|nr:alkaline phosphatase family protein [Thermoplasmata archaeon]
MKSRWSAEPMIVLLACVTAGALAVAGLATIPPESRGGSSPTRGPVAHVVEIMMENHAFDNYFGVDPGVPHGLPPNVALPDGRGGFVRPFWIGSNSTPSPPHDRASEIADVDGGRMDGFVEQMARVDPTHAATPMGYYNGTEVEGYWNLAHQFLLCDNYFASVLGPTLPNRLYAMAGASAGVTDNSLPLTGLNLTTIFDQLALHHLGWKYFYDLGGTYAPIPLWLSPLRTNPTQVANVVPMGGLLSTIAAGQLPAVAVVDPSQGPYSEQPPLSVTVGESWALSVISAIESGPQWGSTVIFLTWDEDGGFYDHVVPPTMDGLGDGFRVPMIVISPFTEGGEVSSTVFDHTSVLKFIDENWGLSPLNTRVLEANDIGSTLALIPSVGHSSTSSPSAPTPPRNWDDLLARAPSLPSRHRTRAGAVAPP